MCGREYCAEHMDLAKSQQKEVIPEEDDESYSNEYILLRNGKRRLPYQRLSCNTKKSKTEAYVSQCFRTFGIIIYVFNCNILLAVHEIMRSETVKEILAGLCDIVRISSKNTQCEQSNQIADSWLPKTFVYDDCCHVIKHIIDYYPNIFRATPASTFLYNSSFSIDSYHYTNHTDTWCKEHLDPNKNDIVKQYNSQSAEQSNSWLKRFTKQFSRFDDEHCSLFLSLMLHIRNCKQININPFQPNVKKSFPLL